MTNQPQPKPVYAVLCWDISASRWYVVGTYASRYFAEDYILGRRIKGLRARYRVEVVS